MNLLSIQSHVAYGHVGNAAAVFALQRIGVEVWPIHSVQFSNHPGYGRWKGRVFDGPMVRDLVEGIDDQGLLRSCDGILSGYLGAPAVGEAVLEAVAKVKRVNPAARYCCDPVIGDRGSGVYVREGVAEFIKARALPAADIVTPNQFELEYLSGHRIATLVDAQKAIKALHRTGPRVVLVTSVAMEDTPMDSIDLLVSDREQTFRLRTPRLSITVNGAGDAIAALFFAHYLRTQSAAEALSLAASAIFGVICRTAEIGSRELALIAAQDELVLPRRIFAAKPV